MKCLVFLCRQGEDDGILGSNGVETIRTSLVYACVRRDWRVAAFPFVGWALSTASVTLMVYFFTGHWLPAPHYIRYLGQ